MKLSKLCSFLTKTRNSAQEHTKNAHHKWMLFPQNIYPCLVLPPPTPPLPHPQGVVAAQPMEEATRGRGSEVLTAASDSSRSTSPPSLAVGIDRISFIIRGLTKLRKHPVDVPKNSRGILSATRLRARNNSTTNRPAQIRGVRGQGWPASTNTARRPWPTGTQHGQMPSSRNYGNFFNWTKLAECWIVFIIL